MAAQPTNANVAQVDMGGMGAGAGQGNGDGLGGGGGGVDSLPRAGNGNRPPQYPRDALLAHAEGQVMLLVSIRADGAVESVAVDQSSGWASLDDSALKAVQL